MPCGARPNTRLLPASTSQPPPLASALFVNIVPGYVFCSRKKWSLHSDKPGLSTGEKKTHRVNHSHRRFRSCPDKRLPVRAAKERTPVFSLVCTHAYLPTSTSGAETAQGGAPPKPHTNPIHMCSAAITAVCCCHCCCCAAVAEVDFVWAVAAITAAALPHRVVEYRALFVSNQTTKNKKL